MQIKKDSDKETGILQKPKITQHTPVKNQHSEEHLPQKRNKL
jgi:hypothetical protein